MSRVREAGSRPDRKPERPGGTDATAAPLSEALRGFEGTHVTLYTKVFLDDDVLRRIRECVSHTVGRDVHVEMRVNPRMDAGAVLHVGESRQVMLDARGVWLTDIERAVTERRETGELATPEDTYDYIRSMLAETCPEARVEELLEVGAVTEVGDGVAHVSGLTNVGSQEVVEFEGGVFGIAFSLLRNEVGCILLGPEENLREGAHVRRTGHLLKVPVGEPLLGRMVDALGQPIDGRGPVAARGHRFAERKAPGVVERMPVERSLHTGIKVIDSLVPLGRGQRELIIGDRKIGKTTLGVDAILAQRGSGVNCIYVSIGQKASSVARVVRTLTEAGAMEYTSLVVALPNEPPAFRYMAPYTGCAMGEYFMECGKDAFIVYDDLSKHAITYREMSALLKRPIGREAFPGDIFYVHSRLLERAAHLSEERGGGSLTALPIAETLASDISAFIPTNIISICDGQIVLDTALFNEGFRPAMDVGLSVSRVGGSAQTRAMKSVAGRLRIDIAQYQEMAQFVKFGAEVDAATLAQLARGERARELLKQPQHTPLPLEREIVVLTAVTSGLLDEVPVADLARLEPALFEFCESRCLGVLNRIHQEGELSSEDQSELCDAIREFVASWTGAPAPSEEEQVPYGIPTPSETETEPVADGSKPVHAEGSVQSPPADENETES